MTLDEQAPLVGHRALRQNYLQAEHDDDAGSPEAEEAMHLEAMARLRREQPWRFGPQEPTETLDRRLHGWREEDRFDDALGESVFRGEA